MIQKLKFNLNYLKIFWWKAGPALMYDSVYALSRGLHSLQQSSPFLLRFPNNASCDAEVSWTDGTSLFNYIDSVKINIPFPITYRYKANRIP